MAVGNSQSGRGGRLAPSARLSAPALRELAAAHGQMVEALARRLSRAAELEDLVEEGYLLLGSAHAHAHPDWTDEELREFLTEAVARGLMKFARGHIASLPMDKRAKRSRALGSARRGMSAPSDFSGQVPRPRPPAPGTWEDQALSRSSRDLRRMAMRRAPSRRERPRERALP